jgi:predicted nucleic acid-binding Zn ribbon protein
VSRLAPRSLSTALDALATRIAPATTLARAQEAWPRAAGPAIAAASHPVAEREGVLTITCEAAVWAQELTLMETQLVASLNAELGAEVVRELRCRTG